MKTIKKGSQWLCIKTVVMNESNEVAYSKGKTYKSEVKGCITDNNGETDHRWDCDYFEEYFEEVKNEEIINKEDNLYIIGKDGQKHYDMKALWSKTIFGKAEKAIKTIEIIILRTLFFLPVAIIHFVWAMRTYLIVMFLYCRYGGEHIVYPKDRKYIADVYDLLEKSLNEK